MEQEKYNKLCEELKYLEDDIKYTKSALQDSKIDYLTKKEFQNDLIYDNRRISEIKLELEEDKEKVKSLKLI